MILDGATGTELQKRGMPQGVCPEQWCADNPSVIQNVHQDYLNAGAEVIYSCTFGANREKLAQHKIKDVFLINKQLAELARRTAGQKAWVAGDIGPTGKFIEPFGPLPFEEAVEIFKEQIKGLLAGGVDLFVIETMIDIQEARAALIAVKELTDKFTIVTMTFEPDGRTLNGTDPVSALITLQSLGADAVGCNCSTGPAQMVGLIEKMKPYACVPLVAKPNAGLPKLIKGQTTFDMQEKEFASSGFRLVTQGVNLIGGCCGTTPAHIRALAKRVAHRRPAVPLRKALGALSSARKSILIDEDAPLRIVGECINPTGKKALQEELRAEKMSLLRQLAKDQEQNGADLLDVNVGVPGLDEARTLKNVCNLLAVCTDLPLVLDSADGEAVAQALRVYPGRALVNSISGEPHKLKKMLPLVKKYGAMFILLPLSGKKITVDFESRRKIIERIFRQARKAGFRKDDIIVDSMVMTVSSFPQAAAEAIKTIRWCRDVFQIRTICGLSNISFGLPQRPWLNGAYLVMARAQGLTMAIANPLNETVMNMKRSVDVLLQKDPAAAAFIASFSKSPRAQKRDVSQTLSIEQKISAAIIDGNREDITGLAREAVDSKIDLGNLVNAIMVPAINEVGERFDKKEYFLPQLIASAETMKMAFDYLEPHLREGQTSAAQKTVVILATVEGDIHDIGKNIVGLMLRNHGFSVVDLGSDVSAEKIVEEIRRHRAPLVGLSALMTTTMVNMKDVIELSRKQGLNCRFVVGGAVVNEDYARSIGADYAHDGVKAVAVMKKLRAQ